MKIRNIVLVIHDQMPLTRAYKNFFVTGNAWGLFHKNSHIAKYSGKEKIAYGSKASALRAAGNMETKTGNKFSAYKCLHCDGYHIGKTRNNG